MRYVRRLLESQLVAALRHFPAVVLTGPRRSGKTTMLRKLLPDASYRLLEDPALVARLRQDPEGFLDELELPVILDEVQNVPEIFGYVRARIDRHPRQTGRWILTGSQESPLMRGVNESMAGRAAILQLWPLALPESPKVDLLRGGFPEVIARPRAARLWFSSYVQTYLERDVRSVSAVHDLATFRRFLALVASRHGQILNRTDLAAPLGMSVPGVGKWLDILEITQQVLIIPPYFENLGKRIIKSPRVYLADPGLACHLLGIETRAELERSPFLGPLFEGWVAAEIVKAQANDGRRRELYYFRDQQGLEVDFLIPTAGGSTILVEAKASRTPSPAMAAPLLRLATALPKTRHDRVRAYVVHRGRPAATTTAALARGVQALDLAELLAKLP
ncbi:MAG TPA: ATP-binding protein [Kofleriaceae bacterium]|jgi:predicted AAA+ superfamily ATPase|nr:ATP-binding protein [Kofleriaceae bacterium]